MIERVFLGWQAPLLQLCAEWLLDREEREGVLDLRHLTVAVPGARAGRRLKELLLERASERKLRFAPPRVVTVGALPELFYTPSLPVAGPLAIRRGWAKALAATDRSPVEALFGEVPEPRDLRGWDLLGEQLAMLHRDVAGGGYDFRGVARICADRGLGFDDSLRWQTLARVQEEYLGLLGKFGLADPDSERIRALQAGTLAAGTEVLLVGVSELAPITARMLEAAESPIVALIHAPPEEASAFDHLGLVLPGAWRARELPLQPEQLRVVDRPAAQAAEVLRELGGFAQLDVAEVAVAAADRALVPYIEEWFSAAGVATHDAAGRPVRLSAPYRLLEAIAAYLPARGWEEFAAVLRHPDAEGWVRGGEGAGVGAIDRYFGEHLPADLNGPLPASRYADLNAIRLRLDSPQRLGRFAGKKPVSEWAPAILGVLADIYERLSLSSASPAVQRTVEALQVIRSAALALHQLPPGLDTACEAEFAIHLLLKAIGGKSTAEEGDRAAVELLGWLELALDDSPVALVLGVNEGALPESRSADPFLPDGLRSRLALQDNTARYARDAFLLSALLHSRRFVRLISGRITAQGDPLRPSRLTLTGRGPELARSILAFTAASAPPVQPPLIIGAGHRSEFTLPPQKTLLFDPPTELNVTSFGALLQDPYRWVLEREMGLERVDDQARELDGGGFGNLAHRVLSRFGRSEAATWSDPRALAAAFDRLVDEVAEESFGSRSFPAVHLQVEILRRRLREFASWQARWVADGWETILVEGEPVSGGTGAGGADFDVDGAPILLRGRIDRVDRNRETGALAILDYKTGETPAGPDEAHRTKRSREWQDLQLPLYRHVLAATLQSNWDPKFAGSSELWFGYILLSRESKRVGAEFADWTDDDLIGADEAARQVVRMLRLGRVDFDERRGKSWAGDPLAPLLGYRQLVTADADGEGEDE